MNADAHDPPMPDRRNALTPEALAMMDTIARTGSFAAAARELGKVPSALTYSVRQLEDALDVLLFDRRSRQAQLTAAGEELLDEGRRLLSRDGRGGQPRARAWPPAGRRSSRIAVDDVISRLTMFELCEAFYALRPRRRAARDAGGPARACACAPRCWPAPGRRWSPARPTWPSASACDAHAAGGIELRAAGRDGLRLRGRAAPPAGRARPSRSATPSCCATAPWRWPTRRSACRRSPSTCCPGRTCSPCRSMQAKIEAQLRCLGCGFVPEPLVREHIARRPPGASRQCSAPRAPARLGYAWRAGARRRAQARRWAWRCSGGWSSWTAPTTRRALLERHAGAAWRR